MSGTENLRPDQQSDYDIQQAREFVLSGQLEETYHLYLEALRNQDSDQLRSEFADLLAQSGRLEMAADYYAQSGNQAAREFIGAEPFRQTCGLTRLVCIYYYGRSGSAFLQSLLDDHPQIITVAGAYLQDYYRFWAEYSGLPTQELVERFCQVFSPMFRADRPSQPFAGNGMVFGGELLGLTHMGPERDLVLELDENRFRSELLALTAPFKVVTSRYFFQSIHAAYWLALGGSLENKQMMVFQSHFAPSRKGHVELHRKSQRLLVDFPASRHLFTLRSPLATLASYLAHALRPESRPYYRTANIAGYLTPEILLGGEPITPRLQGASIGVRLEDLHSNGAGVMRALSSWLKIAWDERLLVSTFHGIQWWNVASGPVVSGFNQTVLAQKKDQHFSAFDRFRLKVLLAPKFSVWSYSLPPVFANPVLRTLILPLLMLPFRMELASWGAFQTNSLVRRILSFGKGYLRLRRSCLQFWLESWTRHRPEVKILSPEAPQIQ